MNLYGFVGNDGVGSIDLLGCVERCYCEYIEFLELKKTGDIKRRKEIRKVHGKDTMAGYELGHEIVTYLHLRYKVCDPNQPGAPKFITAPVTVTYNGKEVPVYPVKLEYLEKGNVWIPENRDPQGELDKFHDHVNNGRNGTEKEWFERKIVGDAKHKPTLPLFGGDNIKLPDRPRDIGVDRLWILDINVRVTNPYGGGFETTFHQELKWDGTAPNPEKWIGTPGVTTPIPISKPKP